MSIGEFLIKFGSATLGPYGAVPGFLIMLGIFCLRFQYSSQVVRAFYKGKNKLPVILIGDFITWFIKYYFSILLLLNLLGLYFKSSSRAIYTILFWIGGYGTLVLIGVIMGLPFFFSSVFLPAIFEKYKDEHYLLRSFLTGFAISLSICFMIIGAKGLT